MDTLDKVLAYRKKHKCSIVQAKIAITGKPAKHYKTNKLDIYAFERINKTPGTKPTNVFS